jgi:hypothetical protein
MLSLLQDKGAPISGTIYFTLKPGWYIKKEKDHMTGDYIYTFTERKK